MRRDYGLLQLWDTVAAAVPERECLVQGDRRLSWAEVATRSTQLSWWFTNRDVGPREGDVAEWESPNDLVGMFMRNGIEYLEGSLGCLRARCAPFNVNYRYTAPELAYLLGDARPSVMIYHLEFASVLEEALARTEIARPLLIHVADDSANAPLAGSIAYEVAVAEAQTPAVAVTPSPRRRPRSLHRGDDRYAQGRALGSARARWGRRVASPSGRSRRPPRPPRAAGGCALTRRLP